MAHGALRVEDVPLFTAVSSEDVRAAQIVTGVTMALFIGAGLTPGLREYAGRIRVALLVLYLLASCGFIAYVLVR
jgi:hypothetical protein